MARCRIAPWLFVGLACAGGAACGNDSPVPPGPDSGGDSAVGDAGSPGAPGGASQGGSQPGGEGGEPDGTRGGAAAGAAEGGAAGMPQGGAAQGGQAGASVGEAGAAGAGAPAVCAEVKNVPLGSYALELTNVTNTCWVADLSCAPDPSRSGSGQGMLSLIQIGTDGTVIYIDGQLLAPSLNLDGVGAHSEYYTGMLVKAGAGWDGAWDPNRQDPEITLWGDNCIGEHGEIGKTLVTLERASGGVTSFTRYCETHYATFWYDVTTSGTGAFVCE